MSKSNCELIRIPIKQINYQNSREFDFVKALELAEFYQKDIECLNSIPITVILDKDRNYKLIKGHEICDALIKSGKEWVIALCLSEESVQNNTWKYELGIVTSKLNICKIEEEDFQKVFEYIKSNLKKLSMINIDKLVESFANDNTRIFWSSLDYLIEAKAGITKLNIHLLEKYFYASPDLSQLNPIISIDINHATEEDIHNQIERLKVEPQSLQLWKIDSLLTSRLIVGNKDRIYWSSGKDLINAKVGITPSIWLLIEAGFSFMTEPTPIPNTSKFLLNQLTIQQLREEAKVRDIDLNGLRKKANIIEVLSNKN